MTLKYQLDSLEGLDQTVSKLYVQKDGKFFLDVTGHENPNAIPRTLLDQEIEKRKISETALDEIAKSLIEEVPEDLRDIIPNLSPAEKIKWIRNASVKGFFNPKAPENSPDPKRPGSKPVIDFKDMKPQTMMAMGYKK